MSRYDVNQDQYCYKETDVLINKLNLHDQASLEKAEARHTSLAISRVNFAPPPYNLNYLKRLHEELFKDIYFWAGEIRNVDISKNSTRFCNCTRIQPEAEKIFRELETKNWLVSLSFEDFVAEISHYFCELNVIHPFREGNGRSQRLLFEHIALHNDYFLDWSSISKDEWVLANVAGFHSNLTPLKQIFHRSLTLL